MRLRIFLLFAAVLALVAGAPAQRTGGGGRGGGASYTQWVLPGVKTSQNFIGTNITRIYDFNVSGAITATKISFSVATADNTADLYDIGIYSNTGVLLCHVGATAGTTFAPATGIRTLSFLSACSLSAGTRYLISYTGNASTVGLNTGGATLLAFPNVQPSSNSATVGGVLNSSIGVPADAWSDGAGAPLFSLHN